MKSSVAALLLLAGAVCGAVAPLGADVARQFQSQDGNGQGMFGYSHPGQSAVTHRDARGNQVGSYAYIDPEGREIRVSYIADENGFRIVSNDQVAPVLSPAPVVHAQPLSGNYLQETPEVAAARAAHMAALAAALANSKSSGQDDGSWNEPKQQSWTAPVQPQPTWSAPVQPQPTWAAPVQQTWAAPVQQNWAAPQRWDLPQPVQDTPEVAAAKAEFQRAFVQAAALAAAQPE